MLFLCCLTEAPMMMEFRWRTFLVCVFLFASGLCPGSWGDHGDGKEHEQEVTATFHETSSSVPTVLSVSLQLTQLSNRSSISTVTTVSLFAKTSLLPVSSHTPNELSSVTKTDRTILSLNNDSNAGGPGIEQSDVLNVNSKSDLITPATVFASHGVNSTQSANTETVAEMKSADEEPRGDSSRVNPEETTIISEASSKPAIKCCMTSPRVKNMISSEPARPNTSQETSLKTTSETESTTAVTTTTTTILPKPVTTVSVATIRKSKVPVPLPATTVATATPTHATTTTTHATTIILAPAGSIQDPSILDIGDDRKDMPSSAKPLGIPTDPLVIAVISVFVVMIGILALVVFLRYRQKNSRTEFRRLQDLPMDDMMEDTPLSLYSY